MGLHQSRTPPSTTAGSNHHSVAFTPHYSPGNGSSEAAHISAAAYNDHDHDQPRPRTRSPTNERNGRAYAPRPPTLRSRSYSLHDHAVVDFEPGPSSGPSRTVKLEREREGSDDEVGGGRREEELELIDDEEKYALPGQANGRWDRRRTLFDQLASLLPWRHTMRLPRRAQRRGGWYFLPIYLPIPWSIPSLLKLAIPIAIALFALFSLLDISFQLEVYRKSWVASEITALEPLSGCFEPERISPLYNLTLARGPKYYELHAGTPMQLGMDCYDFAGTIKETRHYVSQTVYHMYWRADLLPFGERQVWTLKSFFATQDVEKSLLILWSNGDLTHSPHIQHFLELYPDNFRLQIVNIPELARGTALEGSAVLQHVANDEKAWVDGDLVRLLVVWVYGGVWIDLDMIITRDFAPLTEHEFVVQWDCYDKKYMPFNGAVLHFHQHSPYLCEAFHIMAHSRPPAPNSIDWGSRLYLKLWRRVLAAGIEPFKILPWCFIDGANCAYGNSLPDPLKKDGRWWGPHEGFGLGGKLQKIVDEQVFSVHLHNRWDRDFPEGGWVDRMLLQKFQAKLGPSV